MSQRLSLSGQQLSIDSWLAPGNKTQKTKENLRPSSTRSTKRKRTSSEAGEEWDTLKIRKKVSRKLSSSGEGQRKPATGLQTPSTVQRPNASTSTKRFDLQRDIQDTYPTARNVLHQQRPDAESSRVAGLPTPETSRRPNTKRHAPSHLAQTILPRTPTSARVQRQLVGGRSPSSPLSIMSSSPTAVRRHDVMRSPRTGPHSTPQSQRIVACSQQTLDERESQRLVFSQHDDEDVNPFVESSAGPAASGSGDYDLPVLSSPSSASGRSASIPGAELIFKVPALPILGNRVESPSSLKATADVGSPMTPKKEIVPSSQSQYFFAGSSPSRMHGLSQFSSPSNGRRGSDFVPTSQSQEVEMFVPENINLQFFGDTLPTYPFGQATKPPVRKTIAARRSPSTSPSKPDKRLATPRRSHASESSRTPSPPLQCTMNSSQTEPDDCPTVVGESQLVQQVDDDDMPMSLNTDPRYRTTGAGIQQLSIDDSETESESEDPAPASDGARLPPLSASPVSPPSGSPASLPGDSRPPSASRAPSTSIPSSSLRISRGKLRNAPRLLKHIHEGNENAAHKLPGTAASHTQGITQSSLPSSYFELNSSLPSAVGDFLDMINDVDSHEDGAQ